MAAQWLSDLLGGGLVSIAKGAADIVDKFKLTPDEKMEYNLKMEELLQRAGSELEQTMRAELGAKERILVAELTQGDNYTKRARPTVVYFGLGVIAWNYSLIPIFGALAGVDLPDLPLPAEFWYAWGGVVATWSVGRTMERRGSSNNLVGIVTGTKPQARTNGLLQ